MTFEECNEACKANTLVFVDTGGGLYVARLVACERSRDPKRHDRIRFERMDDPGAIQAWTIPNLVYEI